MKFLRGYIGSVFLLFCIVCITGCKKQTEQLGLPQLVDYVTLNPGKVLLYRLDSTVIAPSGVQLVNYAYLVKDSVAAAFTDNTNRISYTIYRYITDTLSKAPWKPLLSYYITLADNAVETVDDNNLRFISLKEPVTEGFSWNGNAYIDTRSATSNYQFMDNWLYTYQNINMPFTVVKGVVDSTITVTHIDDTSPPGDFDPSIYQQRILSYEVYGKGIGLVYKEFLHWTWQPTPPPSQYQRDSYGIKLSLVDVKP